MYVGVTLAHPGTPKLATYPVCGHHPGVVGSRATIRCPQGVEGRYVIVQTVSIDFLTLCEVEVFRGLSGGWRGEGGRE
jgi:hypothetical protein